MKVKQAAGDFRVEEESRLSPGADGEFALYRLAKSGIGTPEALAVVARAWRIERRRIGFGGLKDKYGETGQTISIRRGPRRNLEGKGFSLNYLGQSPRPASRGAILRNRFRITLRDLRPGEAQAILARAQDAVVHGVPDYYDDQRFGSLRGTGGRFIARALLAGEFEEALRLAIASPDRADRSRIKATRKRLKAHWGAWAALRDALPEGAERRICARLADGAGFADAYALVDPSLRSLHLSAYQAHLFNGALRRAVGEGPSHPGADGAYVFFEGARGTHLRDERIPLASGVAPPHPLLDPLLAEEGVSREQLARLPFRPGSRGALFFPEEFEAAAPLPDELNPGREALALAFALRPGSYATILIKRCTPKVR